MLYYQVKISKISHVCWQKKVYYYNQVKAKHICPQIKIKPYSHIKFFNKYQLMFTHRILYWSLKFIFFNKLHDCKCIKIVTSIFFIIQYLYILAFPLLSKCLLKYCSNILYIKLILSCHIWYFSNILHTNTNIRHSSNILRT